MKVIVGLGNPGPEYQGTWHNLGFALIDLLAERSGGTRFRKESEALVLERTIVGQRVVLAKPQTYMNLSGTAARLLLDRYADGDAANLVVACDDVALPIGNIRVRPGGSAGGQKGLKSVIERLGTQQFPRIRMGIKPDHPVAELADYVLSRIPGRFRESTAEMTERAASAVESIVSDGVEAAMSLFNERVRQEADSSL